MVVMSEDMLCSKALACQGCMHTKASRLSACLHPCQSLHTNGTSPKEAHLVWLGHVVIGVLAERGRQVGHVLFLGGQAHHGVLIRRARGAAGSCRHVHLHRRHMLVRRHCPCQLLLERRQLLLAEYVRVPCRYQLLGVLWRHKLLLLRETTHISSERTPLVRKFWERGAVPIATDAAQAI